MDNKTDLRLRAKSIRKTLDIARLSYLAAAQIRQLEIYQNAQNVLLFYPLQYEINLLDLLNDDKSFYLPKVSGHNLSICPFSIGDKLENSKFNVKEPCSNPVNPKKLEIVIVPALMADKYNYRLGYGGGFYDRFLSANLHLKTIVPIAKELFVEKLPHEECDVCVDYVLTI